MVRVVVDSNLLIAALLTKDSNSPTARLFRAAIDQRIGGYTSHFQLSELVDVLTRPRFRKVVSVENAMSYIGLIRERFKVVVGAYREVDLVPKDVKDNPIVAIALEADARYLITDDAKHLLPLKVIKVSGHKPIQIVRLEDFVDLEAF